MFGYRLVREGDWDRLLADLVAERTKTESLLREIVEARADAKSRTTAFDMATTRVNHLELESAQLRHKVTGLPQIAPQIAAGPPLISEDLGAGISLFDDVGDDKADDLRKKGLLHEEEPDLSVPSAAALSADA